MPSRYLAPVFDVGSGIKPPDGAKLFFSEEGQSFAAAPKDTFSQESASPGQENANPVEANSVGVFPEIWITGRYKVVLTDKNEIQKSEDDPVIEMISASASTRSFDTVAEMVTATGLVIGQHIGVTDYAPGNNSGALFFNVVAAGTGVADGGSFIDLTGSSLQAKQNFPARISVKMFGAVGGVGAVNDQPASQNAFNFDHTRITYPGGNTYLLSTAVVVAEDNINVDARGATFIINGPQNDSGFKFGSSAVDSLANHKGFSWVGGFMNNFNGAEVVDRGFLTLAGIEDYSIYNVELNEVANGGVLIRAGCHVGSIEYVKIKSFSSNTTNRGIWLNGSDATDTQNFLVDERSITKNANPLPVGAITHTTIRKCQVTGDQYNIYLMNAQHTLIEDCDLDIGAGTLRNITVNLYSPHTKIINNRLTSNAAVGNKGILVTQFAHDVLIEGNSFTGNYGNSVCIQATYLAEVKILNNTFAVGNPLPILAEMGASGEVRGNTFTTQMGAVTRDAKTPGDRCMRVLTIGTFEAANPSTQPPGNFGETATILKGWTFEDNKIHKRNGGANLIQQIDNGGTNEVGIESVIVKNNTFYDWGDSSNADEFPLRVVSLASPANLVYYYVDSNIVSPANTGNQSRNRADDSVGAGIDMAGTGQDSHYQENFWTCVIMDGDEDPNEGQTYVANLGTYIRTGNMCHFRVVVEMSSLGSLTVGNNIVWGGLPFVAKNAGSDADWPIVVSASANLAITAGVSLIGSVKANTTGGRIFLWDSTTGTSAMLLSELTAAGRLTFGGSFEIDAQVG